MNDFNSPDHERIGLLKNPEEQAKRFHQKMKPQTGNINLP